MRKGYTVEAGREKIVAWPGTAVTEYSDTLSKGLHGGLNESGTWGTLRVGLVQLDGEQNYCEVRWVVWEYHRFGLGQGGFGV